MADSPSDRPITPPPASPQVRMILPTPPSFAAHRARSQPSDPIPRTTGSTLTLAESDESTAQPTTGLAGIFKDPKAKRFSISSLADPVVDPARRVSFSTDVIGGALDSGPKSPVYKIPQRQSISGALPGGDAPPASGAAPAPPKNRRPLSFQGPLPGTPRSPISPGFSRGGAGSARLANTAAERGLFISPAALNRSGSGVAPSFGSIWSASAGLPSGAASGWGSPKSGPAAPASAKPATTAVSPTSPGGTMSAAQMAKQRGLAIAIVKDGGGVVPVTPGLGSAGLKSPVVALGMKSPEVKFVGAAGEKAETPGLASAKSALDSAKNDGKKKEIILCKFYHTPGLTCTSRPCRFVHALSSLASPIPAEDAGLYAMLSPTRPADPTSGTFASAQEQGPVPQPKQLKVRNDGTDLDLEGVGMGERVIVEDEDGVEITGHVFLMSGGGKGAGGKGREKYKTVACKDYAEGHCPYGDYCSFLHGDESPRTVEPKKDEKKDRPTHRKASSLSHSLTAWSKTIPKALLVPSVKVDPEAINKAHAGNRLSAFAPPFSQTPVQVDRAGEIVSTSPGLAPGRTPSPAGTITPKASTPPAQHAEPVAIPMAAANSAPPQASAWAKGPPRGIKKMASLKKVTIADMTPAERELAGRGGRVRPAELKTNSDAPLKTPTSAGHLVPPMSAVSLWTESDPATPFDPVTHRRRMMEMQEEASRRAEGQQASRKSTLSNLAFDAAPAAPAAPQQPQQQQGPYSPQEYLPFNAPTYPWGMPMSPMSASGFQDPSIPDIQGGLGVMWTPAGWAVQDAAMKNALRSTEVKMKFANAKRRKPKSYFRTRPCKFFAEGHCPHGDDCTFLHVLTLPASSPEQSSASSDSGSAPDAQFKKLHPKHQTLPCKFFNSAAGCVNGDDCAFLHKLVVPEAAQLVERPRPWRTKPCRHFQLGRCTLRDACHFAHVQDPAWVASGAGAAGKANKEARKQGGAGELLTAEGVERVMQEIRGTNKADEEEDDEDDVQIVTHTMSPGYKSPVAA